MTKTRLALLALAFGTGCLSSQPERFYALSDQRAAAAPVARFPGTVLIAPVLIPDLIDRPQLVVRGADGRLDVLEHQRWAEALWTVTGAGGVVRRGKTRAVQPASGGGYDALTLAASLAVDAVSADVARAILALGTERPVAGGGSSPAARIR
jgi:uncharacterized lipoprotein YmbA